MEDLSRSTNQSRHSQSRLQEKALKLQDLENEMNSLRDGAHKGYQTRVVALDHLRQERLDDAKANKDRAVDSASRLYEAEKSSVLTQFENDCNEEKDRLMDELIWKKRKLEQKNDSNDRSMVTRKRAMQSKKQRTKDPCKVLRGCLYTLTASEIRSDITAIRRHCHGWIPGYREIKTRSRSDI